MVTLDVTRLGVGAADITKLKANGYYTIAVRSLLRSMLSERTCWFDKVMLTRLTLVLGW
jgi:hypothetical protein